MQGFFLRSNGDVTTHYDIAIIDCDLAYAGNSQILHDVEHLLIWHTQCLPNAETVTGGTFLIIDDAPGGWPTTTITGISVRNSVVYTFTATWSGGQDPDVDDWADDNHFVTSGDYGTNVTTGSTLAALFVDPDEEDYRPKSTGDLVARTAAALIPKDLSGNTRLVPGAIGAYELEGIVPPVIADKTAFGRYGVPLRVVGISSTDPVLTAVFAAAGDWPAGLSVAVEGDDAVISGTPLTTP